MIDAKFHEVNELRKANRYRHKPVLVLAVFLTLVLIFSLAYYPIKALMQPYPDLVWVECEYDKQTLLSYIVDFLARHSKIFHHEHRIKYFLIGSKADGKEQWRIAKIKTNNTKSRDDYECPVIINLVGSNVLLGYNRQQYSLVALEPPWRAYNIRTGFSKRFHFFPQLPAEQPKISFTKAGSDLPVVALFETDKKYQFYVFDKKSNRFNLTIERSKYEENIVCKMKQMDVYNDTLFLSWDYIKSGTNSLSGCEVEFCNLKSGESKFLDLGKSKDSVFNSTPQLRITKALGSYTRKDVLKMSILHPDIDQEPAIYKLDLVRTAMYESPDKRVREQVDALFEMSSDGKIAKWLVFPEEVGKSL